MSFQTEIAPHLTHWKSRVRNQATPEAEFGRWLFVHAAGVFFGSKAGELLNLRPGRFGLSVGGQAAQVGVLSRSLRYSFRVLYHAPLTTKVIVYDAHGVSDSLAQVPPCVLHEALAYDPDVTADDFVTEIGRRWREQRKIPHEIGLALGYPVKDVLGYMGLLPLKCLGCCGWQIFDDPIAARRMRQRFVAARQRAHAFLSN